VTVIPSAITSTETAATPDQLWALAHVIEPDWSEPVIVATSFSTDVINTLSDNEQRRGMLGRPFRRSEAGLTSMSQGDTANIRSRMLRSGQAKSLVPLYSDLSILDASASGTVLSCDTQYLRFSVGARIVVFDPRTQAFLVRTIASKTASSLTLTNSLGSSFPSGSVVYPLIEGRLLLDSTGSILTDYYVRAQSRGQELPGEWCLDAVAGIGSTPSGFQSYASRPILNIPIDYKDSIPFRHVHSGTYGSSGLSQVPDVYGPRSRFATTLPFMLDRPGFWSLLQFFESRAGRLLSFWMASPLADYSVVSWTASGVEVVATGPERDWDFFPFIALTKESGEVQIRAIMSHSRAGGVDSLVLDSAFGTPSDGFLRLGVGYLCRFDNDELVETWLSNKVVEVSLPVLELLKDQVVLIADIRDRRVLPGTSGFDPTFDGGDLGLAVPMYFRPCSVPNERPTIRAADLRMPMSVRVSIGNVAIDDNFNVSSGSVSTQLLDSIEGPYKLEFFGNADGISRHWDHLRVATGGFTHTSPVVSRRIWRATKTYLNVAELEETITVDFVAEWDASGTKVGAAGALFHVFVYSSEVNRNYVEGTPFDGISYTRQDPAVWGGIASDATKKFCHPQMLLACSVPTTWYAPCGKLPTLCNSDEIRKGFTDCLTVPNGAPWVENDATTCTGSEVFTAPGGLPNARAVSLGGGCPFSEIFNHLVVENRQGLGITALKPLLSGWDEDQGTIDLIGGSSVLLDACLPNQSASSIDCCTGHPLEVGGSPDCWRPGNTAPAACLPSPPGVATKKCCFPMDSIVTVEVTQKCFHERIVFVDCVPSASCPGTPYSIGESLTRKWELTVCSASYMEGGDPNGRSMTWDVLVVSPDFPFLHVEDPFNGTVTPGWTAVAGAWDFVMGTAECLATSSPDLVPQYLTLPSNTYLNVDAEVDCLGGGPQGFAIRSLSSGAYGYLVIADPRDQSLTIYRTNGVTLTQIGRRIAEESFGAPYRLYCTVLGSTITANINNEPLSSVQASDCTYRSRGRVALVGLNLTNLAKFDNLQLYDRDPDGFLRIVVGYDQIGWNVAVPAKLMPLYGRCEPYSGNLGNPPNCNGTKLEKELLPALIDYTTQADPRVALAGQGKPYEGFGGPLCNNVGFGCPPPGSPPGILYAKIEDFICCKVRVDKNCTTAGSIVAGCVDACKGVDLWIGICTVSS